MLKAARLRIATPRFPLMISLIALGGSHPPLALAPSGKALLRQRERPSNPGPLLVPTLRHEVIRLHEVRMR